jgi:ATP-dependent 26S proteasome regulatory subunit
MPDPSTAQLRSVLTELVAIPLGSQFVKERMEERMNWFLFYGPMGTGKTLAIRALANQCNALVIDLSVSNLEGKFTDKQRWTRMLWMSIICAK